jgi:hypothetical protein
MFNGVEEMLIEDITSGFDDLKTTILVGFGYDIIQVKSDSEALNKIFSITSSQMKKHARPQNFIPKLKNCGMVSMLNLSETQHPYLKILTCIPGLTEFKALGLINVYPTLASLFKEMIREDISVDDKITKIASIKSIAYKAKPAKRIGSKLALSIVQMFTSTDGEELIN